MKKFAALSAIALLAAGCATKSNDDDPIVSPPVPAAATSSANDPQIAQLQLTLTELLERIDVMNDRMSRLEAANAAAPEPAPVAIVPAPSPAPAPVATAVAVAEEPPSTPEAAPAPAPRVVQQPQPARVLSADANLRGAQIADAYRNALMLYGGGKIVESRNAFQGVFDAEPTGELADNALYWIGETYFVRSDYSNAMKYYRRVVNEFGDQNKAPDALYKLGISYERTSDLGLARQTFEEVIKKYPYSTAAATSRTELKRIKY